MLFEDFRLAYNKAHPLAQLLFFISFAFLLFVLSNFFVVLFISFIHFDTFELILTGFSSLYTAENIMVVRVLQIISHLALFIVPSIVFFHYLETSFEKNLFLQSSNKLMIVLLAAGSFIMFSPLVTLSAKLNMELLQFIGPEWLLQWAEEKKQSYEQLIKLFLSDWSLLAIVTNFLMIAIIPAIGEELVFRGLMIRKFKQAGMNIHVAIWLSAILFSLVHIDAYGFFPRLFLGILLGYFYVFSGAIIVPILLHFLNNAAATLVQSLYLAKYSKWDMHTVSDFSDHITLLIAFSAMALILFGLFVWINKRFNRRYCNI